MSGTGAGSSAPSGPRPGPLDLAAVLAEMHDRFGEGAFTSRRRLLSLLADRMPDAGREIKVLAIALEDGAVDILAAAGPQLPLEIDRLCAAMEIRHGTRVDVTRTVLLALAHGLGLRTHSTAHARGVDTAWVGASSIVAGPSPAAPEARPARPRRLVLAAGLLALALVFLVAGAFLLERGGARRETGVSVETKPDVGPSKPVVADRARRDPAPEAPSENRTPQTDVAPPRNADPAPRTPEPTPEPTSGPASQPDDLQPPPLPPPDAAQPDDDLVPPPLPDTGGEDLVPPPLPDLPSAPSGGTP